MIEARKLDERLPFGASVHGLSAEMVADPGVPEFHVALGKSLGGLMVHRS